MVVVVLELEFLRCGGTYDIVLVLLLFSAYAEGSLGESGR